MKGVNMLNRTVNFKAKYSKDAILKSLASNLEAHRAEYVSALEVYTAKKTKLIREFVKAFKADPKTEAHAVNNLRPPVNAASNYERVIKLFTAAEDQTIELDSEEADAVFNDQWDFAVSAKLSNSIYSSSR
jgi:hypothetical protein